jgi:CHAD domain-containing protein
MNAETLLARHNVDVAHTRHVADLSLKMFDAVQGSFDLPDKARNLMQIGALLHDVGLNENPSQHHIVGRDIVLSNHLVGLDEDQRAIVACMVAFHRKKVRPDAEPSYLRLGKKQRRVALHLASLLRIADGLDYSHTQSTHIKKCKVQENNIVLHISGPYAEEDGARAAKKADLWRKALGKDVNIAQKNGRKRSEATAEQVAQPTAPATHANAEETVQTNGKPAATDAQDGASPPTAQPLAQEDSIAETGRHVLRRHFQKLLTREEDARRDKDIEAVHDMRVASRRLRAILPMLEDVAPAGQAARFRKELRKVARGLAGVRDCDVFLEEVNRYTETLSEEQRKNLEPLTNALHSERVAARSHMLTELDSQRYANFKRDFAVFLTDHADQWDTTLRVRDLGGSMIWKRYEELRAYETRVCMDNLVDNDDEILHEMRIEGKRMRYVLEFFGEHREALVKPVLKPLLTLQDCLGGIQDVAVARSFVTNLNAPAKKQQALDDYVANREAQRVRLLEQLPELWYTITAQTYGRNLMELILNL